MLSIHSLDHVALKVRDLQASADWYQRVLGLKRVQPEAWKPFPIFMMTEDNTGIALFPTKSEAAQPLPPGDWIKGDHYAFRVDQENFTAAQTHFEALGIDFEFQDHHYFHSIYFRDPDGHRLEITTQVREF